MWLKQVRFSTWTRSTGLTFACLRRPALIKRLWRPASLISCRRWRYAGTRTKLTIVWLVWKWHRGSRGWTIRLSGFALFRRNRVRISRVTVSFHRGRLEKPVGILCLKQWIHRLIKRVSSFQRCWCGMKRLSWKATVLLRTLQEKHSDPILICSKSMPRKDIRLLLRG